MLKSDSSSPINQTKLIEICDVKITIPSWAKPKMEGFHCDLFNPYKDVLEIRYVAHEGDSYLKIGNKTYLVTNADKTIPLNNLNSLNAIGNYQWYRFFDRENFPIVNNVSFNLPIDTVNPHEALRIIPIDKILYPCLVPPEIPQDVLIKVRQKLLNIIGNKKLTCFDEGDVIRLLNFDFDNLINLLAMIALSGDPQDYYDGQNMLTILMEKIQNRSSPPFDLSKSPFSNTKEIKKFIIDLKDHLLLNRTGPHWTKWKKIQKNLVKSASGMEESQISKRTKTLFERDIELVRLLIPNELITKDKRNNEAENWVIEKIIPLGDENNKVKILAGKEDIEEANKFDEFIKNLDDGNEKNDNSLSFKMQEFKEIERRASVYSFGQSLIGNAIIISLAFAGGSASTVKKTVGKNKLVHPGLKVKTSLDQVKWINMLQARAGIILGQNPNSKVIFVTNIEGAFKGESESSTLEFLKEKYSHELSKGQISTLNQRTGLIVNSKSSEPLRYKDGNLATAAENHLWALMSLFLNKQKVLDILENTTGIITLGNGDNILNFPRAGMVGEIEYARRRKGRAVATVAVAALAAGDRKGGFVAKVTYKNKKTQAKVSQIELREIGEFPTRGNDGFSAIDISAEQGSEFYRKIEKNRWFIEDIFRNPDGTEKPVAFNIAFYAMDLRLFISRIFNKDERDTELIRKLEEIESQEWVDTILQLCEAVPKIEEVSKGAPNEDGTEEVKGYMTEQMVQDFIVNGLALLKTPEGLPQPEVVIRLVERKDFFLPYKGKKQYVLDEEGKPVIDLSSNKPIEEYDLIANQGRYSGVIRDLLSKGQRLTLGPNEYVTDVIPVDFNSLKQAISDEKTNERVPFVRNF